MPTYAYIVSSRNTYILYSASKLILATRRGEEHVIIGQLIIRGLKKYSETHHQRFILL